MLSIYEEAGDLNLTDCELYIIYIWVRHWPLQAKMNPSLTVRKLQIWHWKHIIDNFCPGIFKISHGIKCETTLDRQQSDTGYDYRH